MKKYIDAEKLIAEIDGMLSACTKQTHTGVYNTCHRIKGIIASLQQEQKPAEWSEEDENMIRFYEMDYNNQIGDWPAKKVVEMRLAFKDWLCVRLKYLRPQPSWKPCKDQMGTLKDTEGTHNGHDYVDLGIRNDKGERILFATCNIGASCPEEYGDYFACGETSIRKRQDTPFTLDNAPFRNYKTHKFDKYNLEDKLETLKETDDVATVMWGKGWRMPGREEFKLLLEQTDHKWVTNYKGTGINGYLFAGKDKYSSSVLFLPAAGSCYVDSGRYRAGDYGDYWSPVSILMNRTSPTTCTSKTVIIAS